MKIVTWFLKINFNRGCPFGHCRFLNNHRQVHSVATFSICPLRTTGRRFKFAGDAEAHKKPSDSKRIIFNMFVNAPTDNVAAASVITPSELVLSSCITHLDTGTRWIPRVRVIMLCVTTQRICLCCFFFFFNPIFFFFCPRIWGKKNPRLRVGKTRTLPENSCSDGNTFKYNNENFGNY